jgi:hypothetical protein
MRRYIWAISDEDPLCGVMCLKFSLNRNRGQLPRVPRSVKGSAKADGIPTSAGSGQTNTNVERAF